MSRKYLSVGFIFIVSSLMFSPLFPPHIILNEVAFLRSNSPDSKYQIKNSVTYMVEINFSLTQLSGSGDYYFKMPRLNNRSNIAPLCPPYQESELLYQSLSGNNPSQTLINHTDKFNNLYDSYNASLSFMNPEVKLSSKYLITLNEITFENVLSSDIGVYNTSDEIFALYCNKSEMFYRTNDTNLINLSNSIVSPTDNPINKAQKIITWIDNNIEYNDSLNDEIGASSAYGNLTGDCSEFSSLMITLLRIQGIPARKITGFCLSNVYNFKPRIGDEYTFYSRLGETPTLLGHAWVEYYVPNIGWIACDPAWNQISNTYFNFSLLTNYTVNFQYHMPQDF
ncbi:MAG: transglutaminase-like domain-containing protein [Candidatus Lokiarchaeota archaeon]